MKKIFLKSMVIVMLTVLMLGISMLFVGCVEEEEKEPVFEIKLYDDNWQELKRQGNEKSAIYEDYVVKYDGTYKLCNVKVFKDEKEFYRIDYKTNGTFYYEYFLQIRIRKKEDDSGVYVTGFNDMPTAIGEYVLICEYNSYGYRHSLNYFSDNTFPAKYYLKSETVNLIIQE